MVNGNKPEIRNAHPVQNSHEHKEKAAPHFRRAGVTAKSKVQVEREPQCIDLVIRRCTGVIVMLIVGLDLSMLVDWKSSAQSLRSNIPFRIIAIDEHFTARVGCEMAGPNRNCSFHGWRVAIAPGKLPVNESQIGSVPDGKQETGFQRVAPGCLQYATILSGTSGRRQLSGGDIKVPQHPQLMGFARTSNTMTSFVCVQDLNRSS